MRRSTAAMSTAVLLGSTSLAATVAPTDAFGFRPPHPATTSIAPRRHPHRTTRHARAKATTSAGTASIATRLDLFDPNIAIDAATMMDCQYTSSSILLLADPTVLLASSEIADVIGQLALLGSVGFGMAYSKANDPDWHYEYRAGNDYAARGAAGGGDGTSDVALLEVSPISVLEKVEGSSTVADVEPTIVESVPDVPDVDAVIESLPVVDDAVRPPPIVPEPAKAVVPSEGILKSAERAKEVVQRVGMQETKDRMNAKGGASPSPSAVTSTSASPPPPEKIEVAVAVVKRDDGGRRIFKGLKLIVAAGVVALVRNVVKAYLGKGML